MKFSLFIEEGVEHFILTPQTKLETILLDRLTEKWDNSDHYELAVRRAQFYVGMDGAFHKTNPDYTTTPNSTYLVFQSKDKI